MTGTLLLFNLQRFINAALAAFFIAMAIATRDPFFLVIGGLIAAFAGGAQIVIGGLLNRQTWARNLAMAFSTLCVFSLLLPLGVWSLVNLSKSDFPAARAKQNKFYEPRAMLYVFAVVLIAALLWCFVFGNGLGLRPIAT